MGFLLDIESRLSTISGHLEKLKNDLQVARAKLDKYLAEYDSSGDDAKKNIANEIRRQLDAGEITVFEALYEFEDSPQFTVNKESPKKEVAGEVLKNGGLDEEDNDRARAKKDHSLGDKVDTPYPSNNKPVEKQEKIHDTDDSDKSLGKKVESGTQTDQPPGSNKPETDNKSTVGDSTNNKAETGNEPYKPSENGTPAGTQYSGTSSSDQTPPSGAQSSGNGAISSENRDNNLKADTGGSENDARESKKADGDIKDSSVNDEHTDVDAQKRNAKNNVIENDKATPQNTDKRNSKEGDNSEADDTSEDVKGFKSYDNKALKKVINYLQTDKKLGDKISAKIISDNKKAAMVTRNLLLGIGKDLLKNPKIKKHAEDLYAEIQKDPEKLESTKNRQLMKKALEKLGIK